MENDKIRMRVIHRCGLYNDFQNMILDFHGMWVIHLCGLYTGNNGTWKIQTKGKSWPNHTVYMSPKRNE